MNVNTYLGRYILSPFKVLADANVSVTVAPASIDGQALTAGDRVFLSAQSTASQNGGWVFASAGAAMTRSEDLVVGATIKSGTVFMCNAGAVYGDKFIVVFSTSDVPIIIGTTTFFISAIGGTSSFSDADFNIYDDGDDTRIAKFQASGITTGTTRTYTFPNASGTLAFVKTFSTGLTEAADVVTVNLSTGIAGGQTVTGGTAASESLTLRSTTHGTKGRVILGTASAYAESSDRLGLGLTSSILARLHIVSEGATSATSSFLWKIGANVALEMKDDGSIQFGYGAVSDRTMYFGGGGGRIVGSTSTNMSIAQADLFNCRLTNALNAQTNSIVSVNNLVLGGAEEAGIGTNTLAINAGSAPTVSPSTGVYLYVQEVGNERQLLQRNEDGVIEQITGFKPVVVSTQFDKTTDTTLANVTGLSKEVVASRTYSFEAKLYTVSDVGGGVKVAIGGTATATAIVYEGLTYSGGTIVQSRATALGSAVGAVTAVTAAFITISGTITTANAGTLTVQFAQNAAVATSSVLIGSTFKTELIPA